MASNVLRHTSTVVIIGGGFSGAAVAARALSRPHTDVRIIDDRSALAQGITYGDVEHHHILNVPAGNMSFWPDRPGHFLDWSRTHGAPLGWPEAADATTDSYLSRVLYGHYARQVLEDTAAAPATGSSLTHHRTRATALTRDGSGFAVTLADGGTIHADAVVYAPGHNPPSQPWPVSGGGAAYVKNPWAHDILAKLSPDAPVLIIGTGLTMVDMLYSLERRGHRGPILAVSRHGLLPGSRGRITPAPAAVSAAEADRGIVHLMRRVRAAIATQGGDWRAVIDGLRPVTETVWAALPLAQKRSFLRHLRPYWEVSRHRMPAESEALVQRLQAQGILEIKAARIAQVDIYGDISEVTLALRGETALRRLKFARVINCTPGASDITRSDDPLVHNLLDQGLLRPDALHMGIDTQSDGTLIGRDGRPATGLFTLGPTLRGVRFEVTAVPDIRNQADALHATLTAHLADGAALAALHPGLPRLANEVRAALEGGNAFPRDAIRAAVTRLISGGGGFAADLLKPAREGYRRQLLHQDPAGRFSIGCFVWGAGQHTPIHDHRSWGVIGVAVGALQAEQYELDVSGHPRLRDTIRLETGQTTWVHPASGDIHRVSNAIADTSISIHVYGCAFDAVCRKQYTA